MVFYRKYRPQTIQDLDNESVRETLTAVLSKDETAHAFLFTGPKGLGKTSTARIVAKILNCEKRKKGEVEPCNTCVQCTSITNGSNLDVLEIDGASHRGIDEIRDLRDKVRLAPSSSKKKVYIIDEVHMLTTEAFNALLKTLEEPPSHVVFILCTTERHKVPDTIASRCFQVTFTRATDEELARSLTRIAKGEKIDIDKDALLSISHVADGSFRDAAKILEEITLLAKGKKITHELVEGKFKTSSTSSAIISMMSALQIKDTRKALEIVGQLITNGSDLKFFIEELMKALHHSLIEKVTGPNSSSQFTLDDIKTLVPLLSKAYADLRFAPVPQLPLELAIIEYTHGKQTGDDLQATAKAVVTPAAAGTQSTTVKNQNGFLDQLIGKVKESNYSLAGVLRGCTVLEQDKKHVVLQAAYKFHKDKLLENKELLEKACDEIIGKSINVSIVLKGGE